MECSAWTLLVVGESLIAFAALKSVSLLLFSILTGFVNQLGTFCKERMQGAWEWRRLEAVFYVKILFLVVVVVVMLVVVVV